jgi:hypothetical protein
MPDKNVRPRRGRPPKALSPDVQDYLAFLTGRKRLTPDTAKDYAKAVTDGTLTDYVREKCPKLLPGSRTLLELKDEKGLETLKAAAEWWNSDGKAGYHRSAAHMSCLLEYRGAEKAKTPKKMVRPLSAPPYGFGFIELLDLMEKFISPDLPQEDYRDKIIACLTGGGSDWYHLASVQSPDFRKLRSRVMAQNDRDAAGRLEDGFGGLSAACKSTAILLVDLRGQELLTYLSRHGIPYGKSVWPLLERLYGSRDDISAGKAFFALCRAVLRDCDAALLAASANAEPGAALRDQEFWTSRLLKDYLLQSPQQYPPELLVDVLPVPENDFLQKWRNAVYFLALRGAGRRPGNKAPAEKWRAAADKICQAEDYWKAYGAELLPLMRGEAGLRGGIPDAELADKPEDCLFPFRMKMEQAELELHCAGMPRAGAEQQSIYLNRARNTLGLAVRALEGRLEDTEQLALEQLGGQPVLLPLLADCLIMSSHERAEALRLEERNLSPEYIVSTYIVPARMYLIKTQAVLGLLQKQSPDAANLLKAKYEMRRSACIDYFFSAFPSHSGGEAFISSDRVRRERDEWLKAPETTAPEIIVKTPADLKACPPVFSSCFDSVRSAAVYDEITAQANWEKNETTLIQTVVSPQIALLQFNQLTDNRDVMKLLEIPALRLICQKGFIVCSPFGHYETPLDYLHDCLKNESYVFSSTDLFSLNGSHEQNALGRERRRLFISYLENDPAGRCLSQSDWSSEDWEEASRLADFCRLLYECFPRCAGHNPYRQTPQSSSLSREIDDRLRLLLQSARASGDDERLKLFTRMKEWAEIYNFNSRSKYKLAIQAEMERPPDKDRLQSWDEKRNALKELLSLVDICYNISNGRNSSSTVELSDVDPVLQPLVGSDGEIRFHKDDDRLFSLRGRRIENGESAELVDSNLMEAAIIAHSIAWSSKNLTLEQLAALANRELGFNYEIVAGSVRACGFSYRSTSGKILNVSAGDIGASAPGRYTEEWHSR